MPDEEPRADRTDHDARQVAEQIVREVKQPLDPNNGGAVSLAVGSQSEINLDEDRIERALIDMGEVSPDQTVFGTRRNDEHTSSPTYHTQQTLPD
jgi:hypothetical protein